jgi:hypothetical protein
MKAFGYLTLLAVLSIFGTATAQTTTQIQRHNFTIKMGATVRIGSYYQIKAKSCHAGPVPKIVQTSKPTIGKLIMEEAKIEPSQKHCAGFLIPGYVVRFEAGDKAGEEKITYEVVYQSKKLGTWKVEDTITVQ